MSIEDIRLVIEAALILTGIFLVSGKDSLKRERDQAIEAAAESDEKLADLTRVLQAEIRWHKETADDAQELGNTERARAHRTFEVVLAGILRDAEEDSGEGGGS